MLMDRVSLHNYLFPETAMTTIGFGRGKDKNLSVIVKQPYVRGLCTHPKDTAKMVTDAGFHVIDGVRIPYTFFTEEFCLGDLHERNVLTTECGEIQVIDCDVRLNTPELGYGGKYEIPSVIWSEDSVRMIDEMLSCVVPERIPVEELVKRFPEAAGLIPELTAFGRIEGPLFDAGSERVFLAAAAPGQPGSVLLMDGEAARTMVEMTAGEGFSRKEKMILSEGRGLFKDGRFVAFDIASGRITESVNQEDAVRRRLLEDEKRRLFENTNQVTFKESRSNRIK